MVFFIYTGCDVQAFQPATHLASPLDLQVFSYSSSNFLSIQFEGFNKESYFSGYEVFISTDKVNWTVVINPSSNTSLLTMPESFVSVETTYYLDVSNYMIVPYTLQNNGTIYYFYVEAYSEQYSTNSLPSEIAGTNYIGP
jgi:hypothetical protein